MRCLKYVSKRAIGFMAGVMILQEFTDPTMILASGGTLDKVGEPKSARTEGCLTCLHPERHRAGQVEQGGQLSAGVRKASRWRSNAPTCSSVSVAWRVNVATGSSRNVGSIASTASISRRA